MAMDPELQKLGIELGEAALRNSAGAVIARVRTVKAKKRDRQTVAELEEIISGLLLDKTELVRIAQAYEQELVAQQISQSDIEYITTNFVPLLKQLIEKGAEQSGDSTEAVQEIIDLVQPIVSVETVTVLQLLGFNFRKGVGEPLTRLVARLIESRTPAEPVASQELQRLGLLRETAYLEIARDPEAMASQSRPGVPSRKATASVAARSRRRRAMTPANGTVGSSSFTMTSPRCRG